jgi:hypothetical protein
MNKKAVVGLGYLISIIVILVSGGLLAKDIVFKGNQITPYQKDVACNALINLKGTNQYAIFSFFKEISQTCKKDNIVIKAKNDEEVFKEFADEAKRCWYRYGENKVDILEKYKASGNWCFVCGKVKIEKPEVFKKDYKEFIEWTNNNYFILDNKKINYSDYMNINYVDAPMAEIINLRKDIDSLRSDVIDEDGGVSVTNFDQINMLSEKYEDLIDYKLRTLESDKEYYVVYSYNRGEKEILEQMKSAAQSAVIGGIAGGLLVEGVISAGTGAAVGAMCGPGAIICAPVGAAIGFIKRVFSSAKKIKLLIKTSKILKKMEKFIINAKKLKQAKNVLDLEDYKTYKAFIQGKTNDKNILDAVDALEKNLNKRAILEESLLKKVYDSNFEKLTGVSRVKAEKEFKDLQNIIKELNKNDENIKLTAKELQDIAKTKQKILLGLLAGATVDMLYPEDKPYDASIEIMDTEEFYRKCGTLPSFKE